MRRTEMMFPGGVKRAQGIAEIAEWFDWMRQEIPKGGLVLPPEEVSALFAGHALRLRDRVKRVYRYHLPVRMENRFIESALVYQCWGLAKQVRLTTKWPEARRAGSLVTVEAERYVCPVGGRWGRHLVAAKDGFRYVVVVPTGYENDTNAASEVICSRLLRLLGLSVPDAAMVVLNERLLSFARDTRPGAGTYQGVRPTPKLAAGFRYSDSTPSDLLPLKDQRLCGRILQQLIGCLAVDIWTLNSTERRWSTAFNKTARRIDLTLEDFSGGLCGADWYRFLGAFSDAAPAPQPVAPEMRRWEQIDPWVHKIRNMDMNPIWELAFAMPPEWYGGDRRKVMRVLDQLECRRFGLEHTVRNLIRTGYFPAMKKPSTPTEGEPRPQRRSA